MAKSALIDQPQARAVVWNGSVPEEVDADVVAKASVAGCSVRELAVKITHDQGGASVPAERFRYVGTVGYEAWSEEVTAQRGRMPGVYKCEVIGTTAKLRGTVRQFAVNIGPNVIDALPALGAASAPSLAGAVPAAPGQTLDVMQLLLLQMQNSAAMNIETMRQQNQMLIAVMGSQNKAAPTTDPMMGAILGKLLDNAIKAPEKTPMSELREVFDWASKRVGGREDDGDDDSSGNTLSEVVKLARIFLEKAGQAQPAAPAAPAAPQLAGKADVSQVPAPTSTIDSTPPPAPTPTPTPAPTPADERDAFKRFQDKAVDLLRDAVADVDEAGYSLTDPESLADVIGAAARRLGIDVKSFVGTDPAVVADLLTLEATDLAAHKAYIVDVVKALQDLYDEPADPTPTPTPTEKK